MSKDRLKILLIHTESVYFGGAEDQLLCLLDAFKETEVEPVVAVVPDGPLAQKLPLETARLDLPSNQAFSVSGLLRQRRALLDAHREQRFDLAHGWSARAWEATALLRWSGLPTVGTLHDHPRADYISGMRQRLMSWSARLGLGRIVCVSKTLADACRKAGYPAGRLQTIYNGVRVSEPPGKTASERLRLGYLGSLAENKGVAGLFELLQEFSSCDWELHIGGKAQDDAGRTLVDQLKAKQQAIGWNERIKWHGWVEKPDAFLSQLDLLIVPSLAFETFGLVLCRAGLCITPVLASDTGAISEILVDNETGWIFPRGDWSRAAEVLTAAVEQQADWPSIGRAARKRVVENFDIRKTAREYARLYRKMIEEGP